MSRSSVITQTDHQHEVQPRDGAKVMGGSAIPKFVRRGPHRRPRVTFVGRDLNVGKTLVKALDDIRMDFRWNAAEFSPKRWRYGTHRQPKNELTAFQGLTN